MTSSLSSNHRHTQNTSKLYKQPLANLQIADNSYFIQMSQSSEKERKVHCSFYEANIALLLKLVKSLANLIDDIDIRILNKILAK